MAVTELLSYIVIIYGLLLKLHQKSKEKGTLMLRELLEVGNY